MGSMALLKIAAVVLLVGHASPFLTGLILLALGLWAVRLHPRKTLDMSDLVGISFKFSWDLPSFQAGEWTCWTPGFPIQKALARLDWSACIFAGLLQPQRPAQCGEGAAKDPFRRGNRHSLSSLRLRSSPLSGSTAQGLGGAQGLRISPPLIVDCTSSSCIKIQGCIHSVFYIKW